MKRLWIILLLVSFSFSITHAFIFNHSHESHCDVHEYIEEITSLSSHGDTCDFHAEFHKTFVIPHILVIGYVDTSYLAINYMQNILQQQQIPILKPPISL